MKSYRLDITIEEYGENGFRKDYIDVTAKPKPKPKPTARRYCPYNLLRIVVSLTVVKRIF